MGKHKTDRTEALRQAIDRHRLAEQADNAIEQHKFARLVNQGVLVAMNEGGDLKKDEDPQRGGAGYSH